MSLRRIVMLGGAAAILSLAAALPAAAKGCNGVVNVAVWGCAPWDNNNGPQFPNYRPARAPVAPPPAIIRPQAGVIAAGGGNVIAAGGGNVIAAGGGNVQAGGHHPNN